MLMPTQAHVLSVQTFPCANRSDIILALSVVENDSIGLMSPDSIEIFGMLRGAGGHGRLSEIRADHMEQFHVVAGECTECTGLRYIRVAPRVDVGLTEACLGGEQLPPV
jgi:hypothetical protein